MVPVGMIAEAVLPCLAVGFCHSVRYYQVVALQRRALSTGLGKDLQLRPSSAWQQLLTSGKGVGQVVVDDKISEAAACCFAVV